MSNLEVTLAIFGKRLLVLSLMIFAISGVGILLATHMLRSGSQYLDSVLWLRVCGDVFICVFCTFGFLSTVLLDEIARHGDASETKT